MLIQLSIRDIVLIDKLDLELGSGLTVLSGETGAGKSILLDAFALALGARGDGSLVRHGEAQGHVVAVFELPSDHAARRRLAAEGLAPSLSADEPIILRRVQMADGRTRAFLNDEPVSVQALRAIGAALVEIHGQHDDRALVDPAMHRSLLDAFGGLDGDARRVRENFAAWGAARAELDAQRKRVEEARQQADWLRHAHAELDALAPLEGEESELAARRIAMQQAEKIVGDIRDAVEQLSGDHAPGLALAGLLRRLERRATQAPALIEPSLKALGEALNTMDLATQTLEQALRDCDFDPSELERAEERLFALRGAARKYNAPVDQLAGLAQRYADDLAALDAGEARIGALEAQCARAEASFRDAAAALSKARARTGVELDRAVNLELPPLKLENARFSTSIQSAPDAPGADGYDRVEFWVQTNPGARPGPLMKIASGGELARFMLALKVVLADRGSAPTLVFDEIDTGVGGAVADAIGARLARLSGRAQVLAVTHAPQVAARASGHYRIAKAATGGKQKRVATRVERLDDAARREEIARMLAGAEITAEARAAAARLLEAAAG